MVFGFRVVRGPGWTHDDKDGGQHHVGTITDLKDDNSVEVNWDTGQITQCYVGMDKQDELRVFDSGPRGIRHRYIRCEGCEVNDIIGTRWCCSVCDNVSLCTPCYHDDCHDKSHTFVRVDFPGSDSVKVEKRSNSQRDRVMGLFPDAEVTRGPHWTHGDQDGGNSSTGVIVDIVDSKEMSCRSLVTVKWHASEDTHEYRAGYQGKVDLCCRLAAPGADYYHEHLACVDVLQYKRWHEDVEVLKVNDKVYIDRPLLEIKEWMQEHGAWSGDSEQMAGVVGVIKEIKPDGSPEVQFKYGTVTIPHIYLEKIPHHQIGDTVRVMETKDKLRELQKTHGGWDDDIRSVMGKRGVVKMVDEDGDVAVKFGNANIVFHPASLIPCIGEELPDSSQRDDSGESPSEHSNMNTEEMESDTPGFLQSFGGLVFLQAMARDQAVHKQAFVKAVFENRDEEVRSMLLRYPDLKNLEVKNIPCLSFAAHQGHTRVISVLLDAGANPNVHDPNLITPLQVALQERKGDAARLLIGHGANISTSDSEQRSPLHLAAYLNMYGIVKLLLEKGCDLNVQDKDKNTPLHFAIYNKHDQTADILIQHPCVNAWLKNDKLFNSLAFACLRHHTLAVDKLISREPLLVNSLFSKSSGGFFPLHIAAVNDHVEEARLLLEKGKAEVNARNDTLFTPLHMAANEGHFAMTALLLAHGADCLLKDAMGNTPLHCCLAGQRSVISLFGLLNPLEIQERIKVAIRLLQSNASIDVTNIHGLKPLEVCLVPHVRDAVTSYLQTSQHASEVTHL